MNSRYYNPEWGRFINADAFGGKVGALLSHNMFAYALNNPVNMDDPSGHWPKIIEAIGTIVTGALMIGAAVTAGAAAVTAGAALAATAGLIIGIGAVAVGIAKTVAVAAGAKDDDVDRINVRDNVINTFAGEKNGKKISAAIDVGTVAFGSTKGVAQVLKNPKAALNSGKAALNSVKNIGSAMKNPVSYMKAWDNYSTLGSVVEGMHSLNLMSDKVYNKLIPIFDPSF